MSHEDSDRIMENTTPLREMRVAGVRDVARDIREIELVAIDDAPLDSFSAGAHVECAVVLPDGSPAPASVSRVLAARGTMRASGAEDVTDVEATVHELEGGDQ